MEISFCTKKMEDAMSGEKDGVYSVLIKILRKQKARCNIEDVVQAYEVLRSATMIGDIPKSYRFHGLSGNHNNEYAINIDSRHRLLFSITDISIKKEDLIKAKKIKITDIGIDYH